jgi:hypothetical protein
MAPGSASLRGELRCYHVSHNPQRAVDHGNKERLSYPRHTARLTCSKARSCITEAPARHAGRYNAVLQCNDSPTDHSWTWLQWGYDPTGWHHGAGHVQYHRAMKQDNSTLLTSCKASLATHRHYDSRCCIGFQPPRGHLSGLRSQCNCPTLSYKRTGQATDSRTGGGLQAHSDSSTLGQGQA